MHRAAVNNNGDIQQSKGVKRKDASPKWGGSFESYTRRFVRDNYWRVCNMLPSEDDAVQFGALIFTQCLKSFRGYPWEHARFMAYYKCALANRFATLAKQDARWRRAVVYDPRLVDGGWTDAYTIGTVGDWSDHIRDARLAETPDHDLLLSIEDCPSHIQQCLRGLLLLPTEVVNLIFFGSNGGRKAPERSNRLIRALMSFLPADDYVTKLRELLPL